MKLITYIQQAQANKKAIWHFNVGAYEQWIGIYEAVKETKDPVIVATSEGESTYIPTNVLRQLVNIAQSEGLPIFLGADHRKEIVTVEEAVNGGADAIVLDSSKKAYDDNVMFVKKMREFCQKINPDIITEGELGFIGASSEVHETFDEQLVKNLPSAEMINKYIAETGIDMVAPALGTIHGIVKGGNPAIDIHHIKTICEQVSTPIVLHGGSGLSMEILKVIRHIGVSVIHINTDIRIVMRSAIEQSIIDHTDMAPYKYMQPVSAAVKEKVIEFMKL